MPKIYADLGAGHTKAEPYHTFFQVLTGKGTAFEGRKGLRFPQDFPDGTSHTIMIVEGGKPIPWTKPEDILYAPDQPLPELATVKQGGFYAAFVDGVVRFISTKSEAILRGLITRNGGEQLGDDW